jgi:polyisoprenoid-binding protein YceI
MTTQPAATAVSTWSIDPVHTTVGFGVKHLGISTFRGRFKTFEGTIRLDEANPVNSSVTAAIDTASIEIPLERLYGHITSPDFLEAETYPKLTFQSKYVEKVDDTHWKIHGDLAIKGATKEVVLDTIYLGHEIHPFSQKTVAAFIAETEINRADFGLTWNVPLASGGPYLGEQVKITLDIEAIKQD